MRRLNKGGDRNSTGALNLIIDQAMPNEAKTSPVAKESKKKSKDKAKSSHIKGRIFGKKKESKMEGKTKEIWELEDPSPRKPTLNTEIPEKEKKSIFKIRGSDNNGTREIEGASNPPRKPTFVAEVQEKEKKWSRFSLDF